MRYFYDTEFIEDGETIDLISIGVVAEDGREYYAISTEFNEVNASDWVKTNVLRYLPSRDIDNGKAPFQKEIWKPRGQIAGDLIHFCNPVLFGKPEFWAYYADYDHVALCQLFGTMMDLPNDWPMYTRDLKQLCDLLGNPDLPKQGKDEHHALFDARWNRDTFKFLYELQAKISMDFAL